MDTKNALILTGEHVIVIGHILMLMEKFLEVTVNPHGVTYITMTIVLTIMETGVVGTQSILMMDLPFQPAVGEMTQVITALLVMELMM